MFSVYDGKAKQLFLTNHSPCALTDHGKFNKKCTRSFINDNERVFQYRTPTKGGRGSVRSTSFDFIFVAVRFFPKRNRTCAFRRDNIYAIRFRSEKSQNRRREKLSFTSVFFLLFLYCLLIFKLFNSHSPGTTYDVSLETR